MTRRTIGRKSATLLATIGMWIGGSETANAQPFNCSAALSVTPEYCADDTDVG